MAKIVTNTIELSPSQLLGARAEAYEKRTGRHDSLDVIRDTLAKYGVKRFSELGTAEQVQCVAEISKIFETG